MVTIGDVIWLRNVHRSERLTVLTWKLLVPRVAKRAARIVTFSEASRRDLHELLGIEEARVDVIPPGFGQESTAQPADVRERFGLEGGRVVLTLSAKRKDSRTVRALRPVEMYRSRRGFTPAPPARPARTSPASSRRSGAR